MIGLKVSIKNLDFGKVKKASEVAAFKNVGHAAATVRKRAAESILIVPSALSGMKPPTKYERWTKETKKKQSRLITSNVGRGGRKRGWRTTKAWRWWNYLRWKEISSGALSSAPGTPPHSRRGQLKRGIKYTAVEGDKARFVVGPTDTSVGQTAALHEFGGAAQRGRYKGRRYPPRPFMRPALERELPRFAKTWANSIGPRT